MGYLDDGYLDLDIERAILASCLYSENAYESIATEIEANDFSLKAHEDIFRAIVACSNAREPISPTFIKKYKKLDEKVLSEVLETSSVVDISKYAKELKEKSTKRKLLNFAYTMPAKINEPRPVSEISDELNKEIFNITNRANSSDIKDMPVVLGELLEEFKKQKEAKNKEILGLDTGFNDLNKMTKGFKAGDLVIIAARPGMGKTTICLNFIETTLNDGKGVVLFSLEMPATQIIIRLISAKTSIPLQRLLIADLNEDEWERVADACNEYSKKNFYIYDNGSASIADIRAILRKLKNQDESIELCVVDYIGLMMSSSNFSDRHLQVSEISRGFKLLARELNMPIIALSQLNREVDKRSNKRPMPSDLRESGALEQDADTILFVYRDDVYKELEERERESKAKAEGKEYKRHFFPNPKQEEAELIVGKNRHGPTGFVKLIFLKENARFVQDTRLNIEQSEFTE
ncbi:replicative DNA helicase [Campylobacter sp. MIT 99-7217]|uniref:replicative DNA helicase n=1 Tax=Campylobacter sp. MIT 99-7217 TaxID=535091 RepID=UPI0011576714|nr:replicative DNA helicase [Campylobacter sp. MIT 99-7217]TQR31341.1 replicative DNA helicase [Campylobacter sp. MIT 99-7217]